MCIQDHIWKLEDNLWELFLSFHLVCFEDWTHLPRFDTKCFYLSNHLSTPWRNIFRILPYFILCYSTWHIIGNFFCLYNGISDFIQSRSLVNIAECLSVYLTDGMCTWLPTDEGNTPQQQDQPHWVYCSLSIPSRSEWGQTFSIYHSRNRNPRIVWPQRLWTLKPVS